MKAVYNMFSYSEPILRSFQTLKDVKRSSNHMPNPFLRISLGLCIPGRLPEVSVPNTEDDLLGLGTLGLLRGPLRRIRMWTCGR